MQALKKYWWIPLAALAVIAYETQPSAAQSSTPIRERLSADPYIDAATLASTRYTGWVDSTKWSKLHFVVTTVDADDDVTNFVMECQTSASSSTANGSGNDVCSRTISGGTETYDCPSSKKYNPTNGASWGWTVENVHQKYINCAFSAEGVQEAADTVTVHIWGDR